MSSRVEDVKNATIKSSCPNSARSDDLRRRVLDEGRERLDERDGNGAARDGAAYGAAIDDAAHDGAAIDDAAHDGATCPLFTVRWFLRYLPFCCLEQCAVTVSEASHSLQVTSR